MKKRRHTAILLVALVMLLSSAGPGPELWTLTLTTATHMAVLEHNQHPPIRTHPGHPLAN